MTFTVKECLELAAECAASVRRVPDSLKEQRTRVAEMWARLAAATAEADYWQAKKDALGKES